MSILNYSFKPDGTGTIGSTVLSAEETQRLIQELAQKGLLAHVMMSGKPTIDDACQDLIKAFKSGDEQQITRAYNRVTRAVLKEMHLRRNLPQTKEPTPRLEELPEAGGAAADTLGEFPTQSANARFDSADLRGKSQRTGALIQLDKTFSEGGALVTENLKPLAIEVSQAVRTIYEVVSPVADDDDRLVELADTMHSYLKDPVTKAQDTKHLVKKHQKRITQQVTEQVQSQARQQARDELGQQLNDQVKGWLDDKKK